MILALCSALPTPVMSQSPVQTFFPAAIPLSIRSPYMSSWQTSTNASEPISQSWPVFRGEPQAVMGWEGMIRIDNHTYTWLGQEYDPTNITNVQITPTRTIYTMEAGPMNITVTLLSPIEPSDWVLQSLPFSYVSLEFDALDGSEHEVQVYMDITAEWLSGDRTSPVRWGQQTSSRSVILEIELQDPEADVEINGQAQDGRAYLAMASRPGLTWQIEKEGSSPRLTFPALGSLPDTANTAFGPIGPTGFMIFAIAVGLGKIKNTSTPVSWALGYVRTPTISYTIDGATQQLSPYFVTQYGSDMDQAIDDVTSDFDAALARATAFDQAIITKASKVSAQYVDLVSLAARLVMATLDITVSTDANGMPNSSDVRVFMKDVGSGSATGRVNPVERMYAALPALLYMNASLVGSLLVPLLDAQASSTGLPYAAQDLGLAYPNATGIRGEHDQGIEQSGNMLVMLYAHARFSGDGSLIYRHYNLTKRWADYLVNTSLTPVNQFTADNEHAANMTNLAIKGMIGVKAMAEISRTLGEESDAERYALQAATLVSSWTGFAVSSDGSHLLGIYGEQSSWALLYNLYADRLIGTDIVGQDVLQGQTDLLKTLNAASSFGLPISSNIGPVAVAWLLFTAAIMSDDAVRDKMIQAVWTRASYNSTIGEFSDVYDSQSGLIHSGSAGPALGAMFSLLALNLPNVSISVSPDQPPSASPGEEGDVSSHTVPVGPIIGGVVGGLALVALFAVGSLVLRRRRRGNRTGRRKPRWSTGSPYPLSPASHSGATSETEMLDARTDNREVMGVDASAHSHASLVPFPLDASTSIIQSSKMQRGRLPAPDLPHVPSSPAHSIPMSDAPPERTVAPNMLEVPDSAAGSSQNMASPFSGATDGLRMEVEQLVRRVLVEEMQFGGGAESLPGYTE
ncbi:DUF1793-domain-containing protein [Pilatotrama ljubarskyi]|nr:DUF1793-domain-containing protein [Pilatotrama ljubarskyi]